MGIIASENIGGHGHGPGRWRHFGAGISLARHCSGRARQPSFWTSSVARTKMVRGAPTRLMTLRRYAPRCGWGAKHPHHACCGSQPALETAFPELDVYLTDLTAGAPNRIVAARMSGKGRNASVRGGPHVQSRTKRALVRQGSPATVRKLPCVGKRDLCPVALFSSSLMPSAPPAPEAAIGGGCRRQTSGPPMIQFEYPD